MTSIRHHLLIANLLLVSPSCHSNTRDSRDFFSQLEQSCKEISDQLEKGALDGEISLAGLSDPLQRLKDSSVDCLCENHFRVAKIWLSLERTHTRANSVADDVYFRLLDIFGLSAQKGCRNRGYQEHPYFILNVEKQSDLNGHSEPYPGTPTYTISVECQPDGTASSIQKQDSGTHEIMNGLRADHRVLIPWPEGFCQGQKRSFTIQGKIEVDPYHSYDWDTLHGDMVGVYPIPTQANPALINVVLPKIPSPRK